MTFISGNITHDDLSSLKGISPSDQIDFLKEDMLQVEYCARLLLDVGWYPSFNINGAFQIRVIKNHHWEEPIFYSKAKTIDSLIEEIVEAQKIISKEA
nr:hypothetical protein [Pseudomonas sp. PB120]